MSSLEPTAGLTYKRHHMEDAPERDVLSQARPAENAGGWQVLWFLFHVAVVYAITTFCTTWLAGWTRGTLLPLLQRPTSSSSFEFLFSHLLVFSFVPAFAVGLINARFKHTVAEFVVVFSQSKHGALGVGVGHSLGERAQLCRSIMPLIVGHIAQRRMRRLNPASPL